MAKETTLVQMLIRAHDSVRSVFAVAAIGLVLVAGTLALAPQPVFAQTNGPIPPPLPTITNKCPKGQCIIDNYLTPFIKVLSAMVGIICTISIVFAGIQYTSSADDPQKVTRAKERIFKSVLTLIGFFLFYAFLNWIIPGGVK